MKQTSESGNVDGEYWPTPFPHSYWVRPGLLLAGAYPGDPDGEKAKIKLRALKEAGIRHVVSLMEPDETALGVPFRPYTPELAGSGITFSTHPICDVSVPSRERMAAILDDIDAALDSGRPVFVHCWGGRGRTGTVIGCWLRRHNLADAHSVLNKLEALRAATPDAHIPSPDTDEQRQFIREWTESSIIQSSAAVPLSLTERLAGAVWGHLVGMPLVFRMSSNQLPRSARSHGATRALTVSHQALGVTTEV